MSTRVGWATIQLIPSAKNFGKNTRRELKQPLTTAGVEGGSVFGRAFARSADGSTRGGGLTAARNFVGGFGGVLSSGVTSAFSLAFKAGPILAIVAAAGTVLGAALTAGLLAAVGGGVVAAGVALAVRDPAVKQAWAGFASTAKTALSGFAQPFEAPLIRAAKTFGDTMKGLAPEFKGLGRAAAPLVDILAPSLADMAKNLMPGLTAAVKAMAPVFEGLDFGALGKGLGGMFATLAEAAPEAGRFLGGVFRGLQDWLPGLARHLVSLTRRFFQLVEVGRQIKAAVAPAFARVRDAVTSLFGAVKGSGVFDRLRGYFATLREPLSQLGATFREVGGRIGGVWRSQLQPFFAELGAKAMPLFREWGETVRSVLGNLSPIISGVADVFGFLWTKLGLGSVVLGVVKGVFGGIVGVITGAVRIIRGLFTLLAGIFTGDWGKMWEGVKTIASGVWSAIVGAFNILIVGRLGGVAKGLLGKLGGWFAGMFSKIKGWALSWVNTLLARALLLRGRMISAVSGLVARVVGFFRSMFSRGVSAVTSGAARVVSAVRNMATRLLAPVRELIGRFRSIAGDVIGGFINGIRAGAGRIIAAVRDTITNALPDYVAKALGIRSPSRVFMALGRNVSDGMARGIGQRAGAVTKAVAALTKVPDAATVNVGAVTARAGGAPGAAPLIGSLTLAPSGERVRDQLDEVTWALRRISRGGVYA
ncbi:hypothetical protein GA0070616_4609 [Micromonospora nigra]|uniref:Phage-related protein n=1 Tax=Micromonospora nigra TaxID=145857 RepID=A0A1C6SU06_9ACTN|nr:hypothetical protein [Micromonospora nigra]SCL33000.1 hypothetical protein GA0070616_4609 [Micromonospora nigra]